MSDISQGSHVKLILNPGDVYRISTSGVATVVAAYGAPAGTTTITANTQDFGPYQAPAKLILTANSGTASYRLLGATVDAGPASTLSIPQVKNAKIATPSGAQYVTVGDLSSLTVLPVARAAKAAVRAGTRNMVTAMVGDSTTMGWLTGAAGGQVTAYPTVMSTQINARDCPAQCDSFFGDNGAGANLATYDTRRVLGSGWAFDSTVNTLGFAGITNTTTTNALQFYPTGLVNTFDIYFATSDATGVVNFGRTGDTTSANFTVAGPGGGVTGIQKLTYVGGVNNGGGLFINRVSGSLTVIGVRAYNSNIKCIEVVNCGWAGAKVSNLIESGTGYASLNVLKLLQPDLTVISIAINDWIGATAVATYQAQLDTLVKAALLSGDVIIMTPFPSQRNAAYLLPVQKTYVDAMYAVVAANPGVVLVDLWQKWESWEKQNGFGNYSNNLHPTAAGYREAGNVIAAVINAI